MSSYSGEAAEQVVRMTLNGVEIAAKISGKAAERIAVLLYAVLRDQKKTRGKARLSGMLKSGKDLRVFAVKDTELQKFCVEAKKYGILYCVLKDSKATDGITDIMVRADDAGKVNRIFERFGLASTEMGALKTEIQRTRDSAAQAAEETVQERSPSVDTRLEDFLNRVVQAPSELEQELTENPTTAWTGKSRQSEPSFGDRDNRSRRPSSERTGAANRPSVRKEMKEIREKRRKAQKTIQAPEIPIPSNNSRGAR